MMRCAVFAVGLLLLTTQTNCQIAFNHGTSVLIQRYRSTVVIAADSRRHGTDNDDKACKLSNVEGRVAIALAGIGTYHGIDFASEANALATKRTINTPQDLKVLMDDWGVRASALFEKVLRDDPQYQTQSISKRTPLFVVFAAVSKTHEPMVGKSSIFLNHTTTKNVPMIEPYKSALWDTPADPEKSDDYILVAGDTFVRLRALASSHKLNKNEREVWTGLGSSYTERQMEDAAQKFTELAERWSKKVGGPIDEVAITSAGVHWYRVKPGCGETKR